MPADEAEAAESLLRDLQEKALVAFAQQCTAHGFFRLTQGSALRRLVWSLAIMGACIGFSVHLSTLAQRYVSYPVSTEFSSEGDDFKFPTVTLCPTNFITAYSPTILSNYTIRNNARGLGDMIYDIPRIYYMLQLDNWNATMPVEAYSSYQDGKLSLKELAYRQTLFQMPYETIVYCRYKSELCDYTNFTVYKDENRFLCMSFKPQNRTLVRSGEGNGLYLLLYNYGTAFLTAEEQIDDVPGFRVALHDAGYKPDFNTGFNVPFGYKTSAQVSVQTDVKVNRDSYPCTDEQPNATYLSDYSRPGNLENITFFSSTLDCVNHLMQEDYRNSCGCLGTHLPLPSDMINGTEVCHSLPEEVFFRDVFYKANAYNMTEYTITDSNWTTISLSKYLQDNWNIYNQTAKLIKCYHSVRHRHETQGIVSSQCRVRCSNTRYDVTTNLAAWPRDSTLAAAAVQSYATDIMARIAPLNLSNYRLQILKNYSSYMVTNKYTSVLDLYAKSTKATVSAESWAYPLRNLFSDLGGILGLWIGVSVISLLEMIELLFQLAYLSAGRLHSASKVVPLALPRGANAKNVDAAGFIDNAPRDIYTAASAPMQEEKAELQLDVSLPSKPPKSEGSSETDGARFAVHYNPSWFHKLFSV